MAHNDRQVSKYIRRSRLLIAVRFRRLLSLCVQTYAILRSALKPKYRSAGPQLILKYCREIEAKKRHANIAIQIEWLPEQVVFHISGQHGGILKAVQFIQGEFLPREVRVTTVLCLDLLCVNA